jgi:hypothetical protein
MRAVIFGVALLAAACGGKKSGGSTPQAAGTCESAASNIATAVPDLDDAGMTAVGNAIAEACVQDAWSKGAIGCFANAATADAMQPCGDKLTDAQQQNLTARMQLEAEEEDPMADEPEEPAMDDSELEE